MKTIEERAKEYSIEWDNNQWIRERSYKDGAQEQKQIDYEAVEAFIYNEWEIGYIEGIKNIERLIGNLKKAMGV